MRKGNQRARPWASRSGIGDARSRSEALRAGLSRDEIEELRARHPIETVVAQYTQLRKVGRVLKGRCPLPGHDDRKPSFVVYVADQNFYCFGCDRGGDVFNFLELVEHLNFGESISRLESIPIGSPEPVTVMPHHSVIAQASREIDDQTSSLPKLSAKQIHLLTAAATVYHLALLTHPAMLGYLQGRGITLKTIKHFRLGYATGYDLAKYFRFRGWDLRAAHELGLMNAHGEFFQQRIVIPELRLGRVIYMTGRQTVEAQQLKYLGLPGAPKPLYGLEWARGSRRGSREVFIVEGAFDMLTLDQWGYPAVALIGSHLKAEWIEELDFAERIYIVTDSDEPGRASAQKIAETLGERAVIVPPLPGAKDVNELAAQHDGREIFEQLVADSEQ